MLFSTWQFIFVFLPISFFVYFWLNRRRMVLAGKAWLVAVSLFFYSYWDISYLPLMLASILANFAIGTGLAKAHPKFRSVAPTRHRELNRKAVLATGIVANLLLLGYYKYTDFMIANINLVSGENFTLPHIMVPLAISFFTLPRLPTWSAAIMARPPNTTC